MRKFITIILILLLASCGGMKEGKPVVKQDISYYRNMQKCIKAIESGNVGELRQLLDNGMDVNSKDDDDNSLFHHAMASGNIELLEMMISKGADVNARNDYELTPLHYIGDTRYREKDTDDLLYVLAELLIKNGADINAADEQGITPLHEIHVVQLAELYLKNGALINGLTKSGHTPLDYAIESCHHKKAELLRKYGAKASPEYECNIFLSIKLHKEKEIIEAIDKGNIDVDAKDIDGKSMLHWAVYMNHAKVVEFLVDRGAYLDSKDDNEYTPLFYASKKEIAKLLLDAGAYINAINNAGKTAFDFELTEPIRDYLRERGALSGEELKEK